MDKDLRRYIARATRFWASDVMIVHPSAVSTAAWVQLKCQFGCEFFNRRYTCPPHCPDTLQTRHILDSYQRTILFHLEAPYAPNRGRQLQAFYEGIRSMESELFKAGYYKAFALLSGPCRLCEQCGVATGSPCSHRDRARPCMEGLGIDVYQTAHTAGIMVKPLRFVAETQNRFGMLLVD